MALDLQTGMPNLPQPSNDDMKKWAEDLTRTLHLFLTTVYTDLLSIRESAFLETSNIAISDAEKSADGTEVVLVTNETITMQGSVLVLASCKFRNLGYIKIYRDAVEIYSSTVSGYIGALAVDVPVFVQILDSPGAGNYTYTIKIVRYDAVYGTVYASKAVLSVLEVL